MPRLPDVEPTLATLRAIASAPTAPYHEWRALDAIRRELEAVGLSVETDRYGQLFSRARAGSPRHALAFVAHTDHPAFEVIEASGTTGRARALGGFREASLGGRIGVQVFGDRVEGPYAAALDDYRRDPDAAHNSSGTLRITAEVPLEAGHWAVLDLPAMELDGDEIRLRAADDLAGCALAVRALAELTATTEGEYDVLALFTRAEETGLYGARVVAEDGRIPRDTCVVSIEASRALPHAPAGGGIVVRAGDAHNTFSNDAERFLRVARERLAREGIAAQRALLTGGTCEASTFVHLGWMATGIALPNVNYHNAGAGDRFAAETIRLSDLRSGIALLVEAALAAGEDAPESWWPTAGPVSLNDRERLARGRGEPPSA